MARFILDARDERGVTVLLIEHHMDVITGICDRMTGAELRRDDRHRRAGRGRSPIRAWSRPISGSAPCRALTPSHRIARPCAAPAGETWDFTTESTLVAPARAPTRACTRRASRSARRTTASGRRRPGPTRSTRCSRCAAGLEALGFKAGDAALIARRQPAAPLPRHARGRRARRLRDAGLSRTRRPTRSATSRRRRTPRFALAEDQEQVDKVLDLREHGAAIEHIVYDDPRGLRELSAAGPAGLGRRWSRAAPSASPREPALRDDADRPRAAGRPGGVRPLVGHHRQAEGRRAVASQSARRRAQRVPGRRLPLRRGDPRLPADGLGRRLRDDGRRRHRAALHDQHPRSARRPCCTTCARSRRPSTWRRRAAGTTC